MLRPMLFLLLSLLLLLSGCKVEMYSGLSEDQANQMLSTLLRRGIEAEKQAAGKNGYTLLVDDDQLVRALQVLKENSLPREAFKNLGEVFAGDGMISSTSEVQARMSYALSQELADTLSRIDGVLTARVHVVRFSCVIPWIRPWSTLCPRSGSWWRAPWPRSNTTM